MAGLYFASQDKIIMKIIKPSRAICSVTCNTKHESGGGVWGELYTSVYQSFVFVKDGEMEKHAGISGLGLPRTQYQNGIQEYLISACLLI
jgi:hypothetical protein